MIKLGQTILKAIVAYNEDFYEEYICKYTEYPDEDDDKYFDKDDNYDETYGTYDDDVDIAEIQALIALLEYSITNHHAHKVGVEINE